MPTREPGAAPAGAPGRCVWGARRGLSPRAASPRALAGLEAAVCRPGVRPRVAAHACFTADDGARGQGSRVAARGLPLPGATGPRSSAGMWWGRGSEQGPAVHSSAGSRAQAARVDTMGSGLQLRPGPCPGLIRWRRRHLRAPVPGRLSDPTGSACFPCAFEPTHFTCTGFRLGRRGGVLGVLGWASGLSSGRGEGCRAPGAWVPPAGVCASPRASGSFQPGLSVGSASWGPLGGAR